MFCILSPQQPLPPFSAIIPSSPAPLDQVIQQYHFSISNHPHTKIHSSCSLATFYQLFPPACNAFSPPFSSSSSMLPLDLLPQCLALLRQQSSVTHHWRALTATTGKQQEFVEHSSRINKRKLLPLCASFLCCLGVTNIPIPYLFASLYPQ